MASNSRGSLSHASLLPASNKTSSASQKSQTVTKKLSSQSASSRSLKKVSTTINSRPSPPKHPRGQSPHSVSTSGQDSTATQPVSSVPPSSSSPSNTKETTRCVCQNNRELGHMTECEECNSWLHSKCVGINPSTASSYPFICPFCISELFTKVSKLSHDFESLSQKISHIEQSLHESIPNPVKSALDNIHNSIKDISSKITSPQPSSASNSNTPPCPQPLPNPATTNPPLPPHISITSPHKPPTPDPLALRFQTSPHPSNHFLFSRRPPRKPPLLPSPPRATYQQPILLPFSTPILNPFFRNLPPHLSPHPYFNPLLSHPPLNAYTPPFFPHPALNQSVTHLSHLPSPLHVRA